MRSRQTAGLYAHLKINGPVASSEDEYVDLALRVMPRIRPNSRQLLLERASALFDAQSAAAPTEAFCKIQMNPARCVENDESAHG